MGPFLGGLKPGLVEKFAAARTDQEKPRPWIGLAQGLITWLGSFGHLRFENLKQFIMDPTLQSVVVESWFIEHVPQIRMSLHLFCVNTERPLYDLKLHPLLHTVRQAKEKSKGTWIEKPLCELEEIYKSPEDREWLQKVIVESLVPRKKIISRINFETHFFC